MSERVLVIDDDPIMLELVKAVLAQNGMTVLEAEDGVQGLEVIHGEHPDLVLSDVMMPRMDGFELVGRVRSDPLISGTPLIILSAKGEEEDRIKGLELGANDYMTKPFSGKELVARVRSTIRYRDIVRAQTAPLPEGPFSAKGLEHLADLTFATFVPGTGNRSAYEACLAAAENPGKRFNPLFLYGGPGLGKTHLMCALANEAFHRDRATRVLYLTSEVFSTQVVDAYRDRQVVQLREQYLQAGIMLIDDIQFLGISPTMQHVAADLLSVMYDHGTQIVISSDRRPEDLETLSAEISTAFALGLVVKIDQPDATLRTTILRATAARNNWPVAQEILDYLALNLESDLRTLGGVAKRLVAMHTLSGARISQLTVDELIQEVRGSPEGVMETAPAEPVTMEPVEKAPSVEIGVKEVSQDPLAQEYGPEVELTRLLASTEDVALAMASQSARSVVVLGTSPAVSIDTVDALASSREPKVAMPEGSGWAYLVHAAKESPGWMLVATGEWEAQSGLGRITGSEATVFLIVLDSMSPRVLEARRLIAALPPTCAMSVAVLVPTLAEEPSQRTIDTLSNSMRRLFKVPPSVPVIMSSRPTTAATRSWLRHASGEIS